MKSVCASRHDKVAGSQRARLLAAVVTAVDAQGYEATSVDDVLDLVGSSRDAFHRHFSDLEECFLAAVDAIADKDAAAVAAAYARPGGWETRLRAAFDAAIARIVDQPAAARTCIVSVHAAGAAALRRDDWATDRWVRLVRGAFVESPERAGLPTPIVRGIVGGVRRVVHARLRDGNEAELPELADGLCRWALSYPTPPGALPHSRPLRPPGLTNGHHGAPSERMLVDQLRQLVRDGTGHEHGDGTHSLVTEAIDGAILSLCHTQIRRYGPERLPELLPVVTYLALTPFAVNGRRGLSPLSAPCRGDGGGARCSRL